MLNAMQINGVIMQKRTLGEFGEALAQNHLRAKGYAILTQNWRCRLGEVDIVAMDDAMLVFVEVKTRHAQQVETAFAGLTKAKQQRMIAAAHQFLDEHDCADLLWRLDAIAVVVPQNGEPIIEHVEDALDW